MSIHTCAALQAERWFHSSTWRLCRKSGEAKLHGSGADLPLSNWVESHIPRFLHGTQDTGGHFQPAISLVLTWIRIRVSR